MSSFTNRRSVDDLQVTVNQEQAVGQSHIIVTRLSTAFTAVPLHTDEHIDMTNSTIQPRLAPGQSIDEQLAFLEEFREYIVHLIKVFRRQFPYQQKIEWNIDYGNENNHTFHILIKPPRSTDSD